MQCFEVSGAVRLIYKSLGVKGLNCRRVAACMLYGDGTHTTLRDFLVPRKAKTTSKAQSVLRQRLTYSHFRKYIDMI